VARALREGRPVRDARRRPSMRSLGSCGLSYRSTSPAAAEIRRFEHHRWRWRAGQCQRILFCIRIPYGASQPYPNHGPNHGPNLHLGRFVGSGPRPVFAGTSSRLATFPATPRSHETE